VISFDWTGNFSKERELDVVTLYPDTVKCEAFDLVDLDHLAANPIYDPGRCSICYHPLHNLLPIVLYLLLCLPPKTRYVGIGLIIHMALDSVDCQFL
jgi:hypothetical protein